MSDYIRPIILCGSALSGKDSLFSALKFIFNKNNIKVKRFAFADALKGELNDFCLRNYGISSSTSDLKEKTSIRDLLVFHGKLKRTNSNGKYWTSILTNPVVKSISDGVIPIITDCRFNEYEEDEVYWGKKLNGVFVYIERFDLDGKLVPPANSEEEKNDGKLRAAADYIFSWPTLKESERENFVLINLNKLISETSARYSEFLFPSIESKVLLNYGVGISGIIKGIFQKGNNTEYKLLLSDGKERFHNREDFRLL